MYSIGYILRLLQISAWHNARDTLVDIYDVDNMHIWSSKIPLGRSLTTPGIYM